VTYFSLFYFLLLLSHYMSGFFFIFIISPLIISYLAILYYFYKYMKNDYSVKFMPNILNFLLVALFLLEIDNILYFYLKLKNTFPYSIHFALIISLLILIVGIISFFKHIPFFSKFNFYILCISVFIIDILIIYWGGKPPIDVYYHLKEGVEYFLSFANPYSQSYTQIYSPKLVKAYYYDDPIFLKYVPFISIPPVGFAFYTIGYVLGDIRIINAIVFCISPFLLKDACNKLLPNLPDDSRKKLSIIPLLYPAQLHLIYHAWTETSIGFFIILFIYFYLKDKKIASYISLGILLSLKQTGVIYLLPFLFIMDLKDWKFYFITGGIVLFPLLLYALWNLKDFVNSIILFEIRQPYRPDSIGIASFLANIFNIKVYKAVSYGTILLTSLIISILYSIKKKPMMYAEKYKIKYMLYVVLFLVSNLVVYSKQSFLNQYYFMSILFYLTLLFSIKEQEDTQLA